MDHESPEQAIVRYLDFLADPASARDDAAVAAAREAVARSSSSLEKLKALSALERAEQVDGTHLVSGFIRHAKTWADANGVTASAFAQMGVPDDVLRGAGLVAGRKSATGVAPRATGRQRAAAVTQSSIVSHIRTIDGLFTLSDVMRATGATPNTATAAVKALLTSGELVSRGADPNHSGRGRAPFLYERASPQS
jgi:hypothetical protein